MDVVRKTKHVWAINVVLSATEQPVVPQTFAMEIKDVAKNVVMEDAVPKIRHA
jgi:hypothetical protein